MSGPQQPNQPSWGQQGWPQQQPGPYSQPTQPWPGQHQPAPPQQPPYQQPPPHDQRRQPHHQPHHQPQYEQPRPEHRDGPRRRRSRLVDPLALVAVLTLAVGLVVGFVVGRHTGGPDRLDPKKVQAGVVTVLQSDYGVANVSNMRCPDDMPVRKGQTYTCTFTAGSAKGSVDIVVQNDAGQYQVQGPRG